VEILRTIWRYLSSPILIGNIEFPFDWLKLIASVLIVVGMFFLYRIVLVLLRKLLRATPLQEKTTTAILHWTRIVFRVFYAIGVFSIVGWVLGARMFEYLAKFFGILGEPLISSGSTNISFFTLLLTIPVFYVASWAGRMSRNILNQSLFQRMGLDESRKFSVMSLVKYGVMVVVVLVGLSILGIDLSALTVIFGVLGIGVGFGLQSVVGNFFAGLIIIITRPIKERDRILVDGFDATVTHIRLLSTIITTITEETIIIPNSLLVNNTVHNYSYDSRSIVMPSAIGVSYRSDLDKVTEVLESIGRDNPYVKAGTEPAVRLKEFGDSAIEMVLLITIRDVDDKYLAQSWNNMEFWRRFRENDIEIPYPQMDIHFIDQEDDVKLSIGRLKNGSRPDIEDTIE
jgi:potassium-dependent mechanosensitive channel